ncbi:heme oxygenase [Pseudoclavibacter endophyticus]|uniref:Biliverdin-producing heme oxygenase n=1 Tax=Pseudoclavibacter endophyticus TaxID=1778590 RepID=A0A6H9WAC2_9MICO|nr:biliverdin-producing heme oxygenase [Pseudoclavibacter endophyticus]KAB1646767.1 biliverdin-producing heme oxygenase [Pseudoclavibacter endophyticus]GGA75717.1 heme oxygenase [Pseudoclavibacter endophyticus]
MTTTASTATDALPISQRLRERTAQAHESAERAAFLERLLGGNLSIDAWAALLQQYGAVYEALEAATRRLRERRDLPGLVVEELDRVPSIESDLAALAPRVSTPLPGVLPETRSYADRIHDAAGDPARLLAHHYTRYLGDLSGGQAMRVMIDRAYGLPDDEARFFAFDAIDELVPFKRAYRTRLDELPFDEAAISRLLDEANESFAHNERIFTALERTFA